jgi:hypothetical protein
MHRVARFIRRRERTVLNRCEIRPPSRRRTKATFALLVGLVTIAAAPFLTAPVSAETSFWVERHVDIPATGETVTFTMAPGAYSVRVSGIYDYGPGFADAQCSQADGEVLFYEHYPNDETLNLMWRVPWFSDYRGFYGTAPCETDHVYSLPLTCYVPCEISFYINDPDPSGNSGAIHVFVDNLGDADED